MLLIFLYTLLCYYTGLWRTVFSEVVLFFTIISPGPLLELLYEAHKERLKQDVPHSFDWAFVLFLSFWNSSKDMIWKKRQSGISQDLSSLIMKAKDCGVLTLRRSCISYSSDSCPNNRHRHLVNTEKSSPVFDKRKQIERASYFFSL